MGKAKKRKVKQRITQSDFYGLSCNFCCDDTARFAFDGNGFAVRFCRTCAERFANNVYAAARRAGGGKK